MTVAQLLKLYFAWCAEYRAEKTLRSYRQRLAKFEDRFGAREWQSIQASEVHAWILDATTWPDGTRMAPDTIRSTIVSFERFQRWAVEDQEHVEKPIVKKKIEKPQGRHRESVLTDAQIEAVLREASEDFRPIYLAYLLSGARPYELAEAQIVHWKRDDGAIVLTKHKTARSTGKPRVIPVGEKMANILAASVGERTEGPLFLDRNGRQWTANRLSARFRTIRDRLGFPKDIVLYTARHTHATRLLENCKDLKAVADALGHTDIKTTQRYVHKDNAELIHNQDQLDFGTPDQRKDESDEQTP